MRVLPSPGGEFKYVYGDMLRRERNHLGDTVVQLLPRCGVLSVSNTIPSLRQKEIGSNNGSLAGTTFTASAPHMPCRAIGTSALRTNLVVFLLHQWRSPEMLEAAVA